MVSGFRNQQKDRYFNEMAGFFAIEFAPQFPGRVTSGYTRARPSQDRRAWFQIASCKSR
jgi:hypothetical protein